MRVLFIINDPPYGTERIYNTLRLTEGFDTLDLKDAKVLLEELTN